MNPIDALILSGEASSIDEAEEIWLARNVDEIYRLVESDLTDDEFRRHPLIALLFFRGSRPSEDSLG